MTTAATAQALVAHVNTLVAQTSDLLDAISHEGYVNKRASSLTDSPSWRELQRRVDQLHALTSIAPKE